MRRREDRRNSSRGRRLCTSPARPILRRCRRGHTIRAGRGASPSPSVDRGCAAWCVHGEGDQPSETSRWSNFEGEVRIRWPELAAECGCARTLGGRSAADTCCASWVGAGRRLNRRMLLPFAFASIFALAGSALIPGCRLIHASRTTMASIYSQDVEGTSTGKGSAASRLEMMHLLENLKTTRRTGWVREGVKDPERCARACPKSCARCRLMYAAECTVSRITCTGWPFWRSSPKIPPSTSQSAKPFHTEPSSPPRDDSSD